MRENGHVTTIKSEGALLPADLLRRVQENDSSLPGLTPEAYNLPGGMRLNEAASRAWNALLGAWATFQDARDRLPEGDLGTTITRERWLLPLFQELNYGRLQSRNAVEVAGKSYAISHGYGHAPIHLVGCNVPLDKRTGGVAGAASSSPHSLLQEFINRSDDHLWGVVSNGLRLRVLRDNISLTRQAYLEFDLEAMMEGEAYSDFVLLYLVLHQSRFESEKPEESYLEQWSREAANTGARALDGLRDGVERAITALGRGFLRGSGSSELKRKLREGELSSQDYYRQLLRLVYRLLFLFVAEDRELLHDPQATDAAKERYRYYSTQRLREVAAKLRGGRHGDLYESLKFVMRGLDEGVQPLGVPALGGFLISERAIPDLMSAGLPNAYLLQAVRRLAFAEWDGVRRPVDFKNLGSEELGSVYESLLELHPEVDATAEQFELKTAAGNERKTTGSYYTPSGLINLLLESALDPVINEAVSGKTAEEAEAALLDLKVVDPAVGSGHFLIAAAQRIAKRLAAVRTGDDEPAPEEVRHALRDVIGRCVYGVDVNEMSAELCKVALWMEAMEPGKPLAFLEHRIRVGNSLMGTTRELVAAGLPDNAFNPIEGDDRKYASEIKKRNKEERAGQGALFDAESSDHTTALSQAFADLSTMPDGTPEQVRAKEEAHARLIADQRLAQEKLAHDAWCAAFVWRKVAGAPLPITTSAVQRVLNTGSLDEQRRVEVERLAGQYGLFHWRLAFPEVFGGEWDGFDVVLGNPPWERTAFEDAQFFELRAPEVLEASTTAERKRRIEALQLELPHIYEEYVEAKRRADGEAHFAKASGMYPLGASGRINTYALFTNLNLHLISGSRGRSGTVVQTGIATDAPMEKFWKALVEEGRIVSLYDFENKQGIFPGVHRSFKFCLLTLRAPTDNPTEEVQCGFFLQRVEDVRDSEFTYRLRVADLAVINPNTKQPPVCRSEQDLELLLKIQRDNPILTAAGDSSPRARAWVALTSSGASEHYLRLEELPSYGSWDENSAYTADGTRYLPLLEAKQIHQFNPAFGTYEGVSQRDWANGNPRAVEPGSLAPALPRPRFWAKEDFVELFLATKGLTASWVPAIRDVARSTDERTSIACILPRVGMIQPLNGIAVPNAIDALWVVSALNSFALDFVAKQKVPGMHLNVTIFGQLPVPTRTEGWLSDHIIRGALELTYTVGGLRGLANEVGYHGPPFKWNEDRRFWLRCEQDAAWFHLYGLSQDDVSYIMEAFTVVKRADEAQHGCYRTKDAILEIYDEMALCREAGREYQTRLDPPPAHPSLAHISRSPQEV